VRDTSNVHTGVAHHLGWAILVTATDFHRVVDRRRIDLIDDSLPAAPIHHHGGAHEMHADGAPLDDEALAALVADVRASAAEHAVRALDGLAAAFDAPIVSMSVRDWPDGLPTDIATLRRPPYESRADSMMYCAVLAEAASDRGWDVHRFDAKTIEGDATAALGGRADLLARQRSIQGPPWNKDHRIAFAATVVAACASASG
jgi:hypothetical protein